MRIAFVTQWFPPEPRTHLSAAIADGLANRGHDVDVITGFPNYPSGRLHPDYPMRPYLRETTAAGAVVHRAPLYPSHDRSALRRGANYLSFAVSASWLARRRIERPDAWLIYSSPATAALPILTVPQRLRARNYLIIQDMWPEAVTDSGFLGRLGGPVENGLGRFCSAAYAAADGIGIISPGMRSLLVARGVPDEKLHYTPNPPPDHGRSALPQARRAELRREFGLPEKRIFVYAGNVGELQGLEPLVTAFGHCPAAHLVIVGDGVARSGLQDLVHRDGIRNVSFLPSQPDARMPDVVGVADVLVVSLRDTALLRAAMPSKIQASLAAGKPILAHAAGDAADLVGGSGAGLATPPGDIRGCVAAIGQLTEASADVLADMGMAARNRFEAEFTEDRCLARLLAMMGDPRWLAGEHPIPGARRPSLPPAGVGADARIDPGRAAP